MTVVLERKNSAGSLPEIEKACCEIRVMDEVAFSAAVLFGLTRWWKKICVIDRRLRREWSGVNHGLTFLNRAEEC